MPARRRSCCTRPVLPCQPAVVRCPPRRTARRRHAGSEPYRRWGCVGSARDRRERIVDAEAHRGLPAGALSHGVENRTETLTVSVDATRVAQILSNLLDNTHRYTPAGGSITLDLNSGREVAEVTVTTTGPGIPAPRALPQLRTVGAPGCGRRPRPRGAGLQPLAQMRINPTDGAGVHPRRLLLRYAVSAAGSSSAISARTCLMMLSRMARTTRRG